ncbi:GDSL esterase/lipase [Spatholobus suberectus]|nr:GDSL esterase/lipase [Spatholobus suberectus]
MAYTIHFIILMHVCTIVVVTSISNDLTRPKFSSILVFGDSTVDTGNNNYISTLAKGNHLPYGKDFPGHVPTGRFSNGKLVPDFIASMLNLKDTVPPFLDPNLSDEELLTGLSFASGGSGFDDLTTALSGAIAVSKQIEHFKVYVARLRRIAGENEIKRILGDALVIISAGTNDFLFNFYDIPTRKSEFNIDGYQDYVQNRLQIFVKELYDLGCRKFAVTGLPSIGCIPIQITAKFVSLKDRKCVEDENSDAKLYNRKLAWRLLKIQAMLPGSRVIYTDVYDPLINLIHQPEKYGFKETSKGCCGTGLFEVTPLCNEITPICEDPSKYVFWDSVHPTEVAYQYIAKYVEMEYLKPYVLFFGSKTRIAMRPTLPLIILIHVCAIVVSMSNTMPNFSSILVFGDSTVDTGNNNYIKTLARGNHLPYGRDFPGHVPTGRISNGKLVPDFIASALNLKDTVPPYLDPNLSKTGVCFASAGAGIDDLTAASFNALSMSKQIEYFKAYAAKLKQIVGENETKQILGDALVICVGANDFILNFYDLSHARVTFSINKYQDYLLDRLQIFIKDLYDHGCRKIGVAGLAPIGCLPFQITIKLEGNRKCVMDENSDSEQYNRKLAQRLPQMQAMLPGSRLVYADLYYPILNLINHSEKYGEQYL